MSVDCIIIHIFYYFLIWTSIIVPLAVFSITYGRIENQWKAGVVVYGILTLAIWGLTKTQLVTMISFVLPVIWLLNTMIFLKGTKRFKASLAFASYVISICIEAITATILAVLSILFPRLHIISVNIGRFGNTLTIVLVSVSFYKKVPCTTSLHGKCQIDYPSGNSYDYYDHAF